MCCFAKLVYLPRVELGSMPSEGIILSIRLQVGTLFIVAYFVFIRKGYKDIFPFRQKFFVKIVAKRLIIAKFCGIFNKLYSACMCWCGGISRKGSSMAFASKACSAEGRRATRQVFVSIQQFFMLVWWNGRRVGLKIRCW